MKLKVKIALSVPDSQRSGKYFSFLVKEAVRNEYSEYLQPRRVFVISNVVNNFDAFCKQLMKFGIIDSKLQWLFEDNHLVILGDNFTNCDQIIECLWFIYSLEEKAKRRKGYVHFILGNYDIIRSNNQWRDEQPKYAENTKSVFPHAAFYDGNNELYRWLKTKNIMERIGKVLFVHRGISADLVKLGYSIEEINGKVRPYYADIREQYADPLLEVVYNNTKSSPFWFSGYAESDLSEKQIKHILKHFGVRTIVTGLNYSSSGDNYFNGMVLNVNTNKNDSPSEALLISRNRFYKITSDGKRVKVR